MSTRRGIMVCCLGRTKCDLDGSKTVFYAPSRWRRPRGPARARNRSRRRGRWLCCGVRSQDGLEALGVSGPCFGVEQAGRVATPEHLNDLVCRVAPHGGPRFGRDTRGVVGRDDVVLVEKWMVERWRLDIPHIDPGAGEM